jgi:DNA repair exonuclease SbcCD ATPase subunit
MPKNKTTKKKKRYWKVEEQELRKEIEKLNSALSLEASKVTDLGEQLGDEKKKVADQRNKISKAKVKIEELQDEVAQVESSESVLQVEKEKLEIRLMKANEKVESIRGEIKVLVEKKSSPIWVLAKTIQIAEIPRVEEFRKQWVELKSYDGSGNALKEKLSKILALIALVERIEADSGEMDSKIQELQDNLSKKRNG